MYGYIYKTTNLVNGKIYVGQKKSDKFLHESYLGSGKNLKLAINRYGKNNFNVELLEACNSKEELDKREIFWIAELKSNTRGIGYNIASGGGGVCLPGELNPNYGKKFSEETRRKLSESHKGIQAGENHPMYGKHHTEESKLKNSIAHRGANHPNFGKHLSEETRRKMSEKARNRTHEKCSMYGKHHSEETKKKIKEAQASKKVINLDTGEIFNSFGDAARKYNSYPSSICYCCQGKYKTAAGQHWKYYDE